MMTPEERLATLEAHRADHEGRHKRFEYDQKTFMTDLQAKVDGISTSVAKLETIIKNGNGNRSKKGYVATGGIVGAIVILAEVLRSFVG